MIPLSDAMLILKPLFPVFFCAVVTMILPRLKTKTGGWLSLALLAGYILSGMFFYPLSQSFFETTLSVLILIVGYLVVVISRAHKGRGVEESREGVSAITDTHSRSALPEDAHAISIIGNYQVSNEIARDFFGAVFIGEDASTHQNAVIRTVQLSGLCNDDRDEIKSRFFRELKNCSLLIHPNIVSIYQWGEDQDLLYVATEYYQGKSLDQLLKRGRHLAFRDVLQVIGLVAHALDFAHRQNIVHQYILPSNLLIARRDRSVKIAEFGTAWMSCSNKAGQDSFLDFSHYMSPEQISGKRMDGRSDIFSLGVVLFEMLTGQRPFEDDDLTSVVLKISKERHPSPKSINPKIPVVIERLIDKALEKDVEKRYQRAGQMADHLNRVVARIDELAGRKTLDL